MRTYLKYVFVMIVLVAGALILSACSPKSYTRVLWPKPPLVPKLEFVGVYAGNEDFNYGTFEQAMFDMFDDKVPLFKMPYGIAGNNSGDIFVSDFQGVKVINLANKTFKKIVSINIVSQPLGVATDSLGRLYVADSKSKKVFILDENGRHLRTFGGKEVFGKPSHIAINERLGLVYVSDSAKHRIVVFDREGAQLFTIGKAGKGAGEFAFPQGIAVAPDDTLYVADMLNGRIQVFSAKGEFIRTFGQTGTNYWDFEAPRDLAFGPDGNIYIVDFRKALLMTYTPEGKMLFVTGDLKKRTSHPLGMSSPVSIHINKEGTIHITDLLNHRIVVWQILTPDYLVKHPVATQ